MADPTTTNIVGAPLPEQTSDAKPALEGKGEGVIVSVHNPLTQDFRIQYARSVIQAGALSREQQFAMEKGLNMTKDQNSQAHSVQFLVLKAGETKNLPGDIAQIAVRQMVTHILQVRHKGSSRPPVADNQARAEVEKELIVNVSDNMDFYNSPQTPEEYTATQVASLNPILEPPAPQDAPNPPPGQGMTYEPGTDGSTEAPSPSDKTK